MSQYLLSFAKQHISNKSKPYLIILWSLSRAQNTSRRYSDHIKDYLNKHGDYILGRDFEAKSILYENVLKNKKELDWVTTEGLSEVTQLVVKDFRGFGSLEKNDAGNVLNFRKGKNIFYAPNGGGKTSLCEALEFGTTAHIKEADRRKTKIKKYISRGSSKYSLELYGSKGKAISQSLQWSNCFIDRNRLQEFSLLGSKDTGSAEKDVVASLFGLEEFQETLSRFILPSSFNLSSLKRTISTSNISAIDENIKSSKIRIGKLRNISASQDLIACNIFEIEATDTNKIRDLFKLNKKLSSIKSSKIATRKISKAPAYVKFSKIRAIVKYSKLLLKNKTHLAEKVLSNASSLNFRAIYDAIIAIEESNPSFGACPACGTSIDLVTENPFFKAKKEIEKLGFLETLNLEINLNEKRIISIAAQVEELIEGHNKNAQLNLKGNFSLNDLVDAAKFHSTSLHRLDSGAVVLQRFVDFFKSQENIISFYLEECKKQSNSFLENDRVIQRLNNDINKINGKCEQFQTCINEKNLALRQIKEAGEELRTLFIEKQRLKSSADHEEKFNRLLDSIVKEYGNLHSDLLQFKIALEKNRIKGIEQKAVEYYQKINYHDGDHEKIKSLKFVNGSDGYRVEITNQNSEKLDAFSVLSEGHLRVLGLSLLLSMAHNNKLPMIVFDDVVNAIDSDHRANIIELLFSDSYLKTVQMIVTTHDRLFWERFCNIAEKNTYADQNQSHVLMYTNRGIVVVNYAGGFREKIEYALCVFDVRQALIYCRIWFETMVVDFCLEKKVEITARFERGNKKNNLLQISLEKTFSLVEPYIAYDKSKFDLIKNNLINWNGQNQEHHAFDEFSYNFVHSKSSAEVIVIFDAIRMFECQLFPEEKTKSCNGILAELNSRIANGTSILAGMAKAPADVQEKARLRLVSLQKAAETIQDEIDFMAACELAKTPPPNPA